MRLPRVEHALEAGHVLFVALTCEQLVRGPVGHQASRLADVLQGLVDVRARGLQVAALQCLFGQRMVHAALFEVRDRTRVAAGVDALRRGGVG